MSDAGCLTGGGAKNSIVKANRLGSTVLPKQN
jgi:hypothetical protein